MTRNRHLAWVAVCLVAAGTLASWHKPGPVTHPHRLSIAGIRLGDSATEARAALGGATCTEGRDGGGAWLSAEGSDLKAGVRLDDRGRVCKVTGYSLEDEGRWKASERDSYDDLVNHLGPPSARTDDNGTTVEVIWSPASLRVDMVSYDGKLRAGVFRLEAPAAPDSSRGEGTPSTEQ